MASFATWRVGTLTVPSSTGDVSVSGLGGTPAAVIFYGANFTDEDSVISAATGHALFRGMAAPDFSDPDTLLQNAACAGPTGNQHMIDNYAILNLTTAGSATVLYRATVAFDADGFTASFDTAASGGYKVIYVALFDVDNVGAYVGAVNQSSITLGWPAGASVLHGAWAGPVASGSDRTQEWYGGAAYAVNEGIGANVFTFPTSFQGQYNIGVQNQAASTSIVQGGRFSGPFLVTSNITSGVVSSTNLSFAGEDENGGMIVAWDDQDSDADNITPAASVDGTATVSGLTFAPGLVLGYSTSNEADGQGTGALGALGFSVITPDFQWSALVEEYDAGYTTFGTGRGALQSFTNGVIDAIDDADYHAATVELTDDGFVLTTTVADISPDDWGWHAFGHPVKSAVWIPQIYRRL
jgi:hypothetical protein